MKAAEALVDVQRVFMDSAPLIYFVERFPEYVDRVRDLFQWVREAHLTMATSVVTLTEVLTKPVQAGDTGLIQTYREMLFESRNLILLPITASMAERAAELRANYRLKTPDALQIAAALQAGCEGFVTNDRQLQRVKELRVVVLDDLSLDLPE